MPQQIAPAKRKRTTLVVFVISLVAAAILAAVAYFVIQGINAERAEGAAQQRDEQVLQLAGRIEANSIGRTGGGELAIVGALVDLDYSDSRFWVLVSDNLILFAKDVQETNLYRGLPINNYIDSADFQQLIAKSKPNEANRATVRLKGETYDANATNVKFNGITYQLVLMTKVAAPASGEIMGVPQTVFFAGCAILVLIVVVPTVVAGIASNSRRRPVRQSAGPAADEVESADMAAAGDTASAPAGEMPDAGMEPSAGDVAPETAGETFPDADASSVSAGGEPALFDGTAAFAQPSSSQEGVTPTEQGSESLYDMILEPVEEAESIESQLVDLASTEASSQPQAEEPVADEVSEAPQPVEPVADEVPEEPQPVDDNPTDVFRSAIADSAAAEPAAAEYAAEPAAAEPAAAEPAVAEPSEQTAQTDSASAPVVVRDDLSDYLVEQLSAGVSDLYLARVDFDAPAVLDNQLAALGAAFEQAPDCFSMDDGSVVVALQGESADEARQRIQPLIADGARLGDIVPLV